MYRKAKRQAPYSITDNLMLGRRRRLSVIAGRALAVIATLLGALTLVSLVGVVSGAGWVSGNPFAPGLFVPPLLLMSMWQHREERRFVHAYIGRDALILDREEEHLSIPWRDVIEARAGRGFPVYQREMAGFLSVRFSAGGVTRKVQTVAPGAEAARVAVEEIRQRAAAAMAAEA